MDTTIHRLSKTYPGTSGQNDPNLSLQAEKSLKAPGSLTEQVLVGMLNDVFSSCVFRTAPSIDSEPVRLELRNSNSQVYYMVSLRWSRAKVDIQAISHTFNVFDKWTTLSQDDTRKYGQKGSLIALGLFTSLKLCLKEPCDAAKIPISIVKNYINREINKGGYWAYMCCPVFLSERRSPGGTAQPEESEEALHEARKLQEDQRDRLAKLVKLSSETLEVVSPTTILALLWSIYYTNSHRRLQALCGALVNEFLSNYGGELPSLVYVLYLSQRMGLLAGPQLEELLVAKFNSVTALERLSAQDVVVLVNALGFSDAGALLAQKASTMLHHHVEDLGAAPAVYLLTGLMKLSFNFHHNDLFTKKLLSRILAVYDEIDSSELLEVLFNTLSILPYDVVGHFNEFISKTLTRLHRLTVNEIGRIGCCYATAVNTSEILAAIGGLPADKRAKPAPLELNAPPETGGPGPARLEPQQTSARRLAALKQVLQGRGSHESRHIYHCLEHHFRAGALAFSSMELDLLGIIHESVVYGSGFHFSSELAQKGFRYNKAWLHSFSLNTPLSHSAKVTRKVNVRALDAQSSNPAYANSYKMFFLNLIDDCCSHSALFDQTLIDQVVFSLLTLRIDLSPINEAMLVSKGEIVKTPGGITQIKIVEHLEDMLRQYSMAREIMSWSRVKQGMDGSVVISGVEIDESSIYLLSRDKRRLTSAPVVVPAAPKQPQGAGKGPRPATIVSGGGTTPAAPPAATPPIPGPAAAASVAPAQPAATTAPPAVAPAASVPAEARPRVEPPPVAPPAAAATTVTPVTAATTGPSGPTTTNTATDNIALNGVNPTATQNGTPTAAATTAATPNPDAKTANLTETSHKSLENMVKMMMGLPETAELEGNPILEFIKSYRANSSNAASANTPSNSVEGASGIGRAEEPAAQNESPKGVFRNSRASNGSNSREIENANRARRQLTHSIKGRRSIERLKDKKKKNKNDGKKYELFFRLKTSKRVKMELEKRELQIIYKYVKIK